jgi:hypothetical protein
MHAGIFGRGGSPFSGEIRHARIIEVNQFGGTSVMKFTVECLEHKSLRDILDKLYQELFKASE